MTRRVTIYDVAHSQHLDWGCVAYGQTRGWFSENYLAGSYCHIRGEAKQNADCSGDTICDTEIEVAPTLNGTVSVTLSNNQGGCAWSGNTGNTMQTEKKKTENK